MKRKFDVGDIVRCKFPSEEGVEIGEHYCLVLEVEDESLLVAFGTSKKIGSVSLQDEVVITDPSDLLECGLRITTKFVLSKRDEVRTIDSQYCGSLPRHKYKCLFAAAQASGYISNV